MEGIERESSFHSFTVDFSEESVNLSQLTPRKFPFSIYAFDLGQPLKIEGVNGHQNALQNGGSNSTSPKIYFTNLSQRTHLSLSDDHYNKFSDKRFYSFKTQARKFEKQISNLSGKSSELKEMREKQSTDVECLPPIERYFDALEGPELDSLRTPEELLLPENENWPFLLRFPISSFGICLGSGSQAMLWKTLASSPPMDFMSVSPKINFVLWCIAAGIFCLVTFVYTLKIVTYFEAVRREYYHPVRVNFFFAPWISCLFLALSLPPSVGKKIPATLWYALMAPIFFLELKIYGQWMSGGDRRLSKIANPSNHMAVVGNFVGATLGANIGLKEGPLFFFSVGVAHYLVLFVTLYQRLPTNETLPKELHPVFFLFIAAPSAAGTAWASISGEFGIAARIPYFIALFLYCSFAVRVNFFRGFRFSLAWWAYTFPMASAAIATIRYTEAVEWLATKCLSVALSTVSTFTAFLLLICTILHALVFHNLFPNDIAIAISHKKPSLPLLISEENQNSKSPV